MNKNLIIALLAIAIIITSIYAGFMAYHLDSYNSNTNGYGQAYAISNQTFNEINSIPQYISTNERANLIYDNASVSSIVMEGSPLWYNSTMEFFLVYNMTNPTLVLKAGSTVKITFINMDRMTHNLAIVSFSPPYNYMPGMSNGSMMNDYNGTMMGGGGMMGSSSMMSGIMLASPMMNGVLSNGSYNAINIQYRFSSSGTYWYICMYPGHAEHGMYGKIVVD